MLCGRVFVSIYAEGCAEHAQTSLKVAIKFHSKMASSSATHARESYTTEQVIQNIFADEDPENEQVDSETDESEEETSDENDKDIQVEAAEESPVRGCGEIRRSV